MNLIMSFILYNPLEAFMLMLPLWVYNYQKIDFSNKKKLVKVFIKDMYILSTIFLILQIPLNLLEEKLLYSFYNIVVCVCGTILILYLYLIKRFKIKQLHLCVLTELYYSNSLMFAVMFNNFIPILLKEQHLYEELLANITIKLIQFFILLFILGGFIMIKKRLVRNSQKNLSKMVASTQYSFGEKKLSDKLKKEIKK